MDIERTHPAGTTHGYNRNTLVFKFRSANETLVLDTTEFCGPDGDLRRCVRGLNSVATDVGTFCWSNAVRALSILALRHVIYADSPDAQERSLSGLAGSPASSLDYAITKQTGWLLDIFGLEPNGVPVIRKLVTRQNSERKRPGPVVIGFTKKDLGITFFLDDRPISDIRVLHSLLTQLESISAGGTQAIVESAVAIVNSPNTSLVRSRRPSYSSTADLPCPYKGLLPFGQPDAGNFYGRENETEHLLEKVTRTSVVVVVGASGSGKTSLISAGLLPLFASESRNVSNNAQRRSVTIRFRPMNHAFRALASGIINTLRSAQTDVIPGDELSRLSHDLENGNFAKLLDFIWPKSDSSSQILFYGDQFEELFTSCPEPTRHAFLQELASLIRSDDRYRLILSIRSDFYSQLMSTPFTEFLEHGTFPLAAMRRDQLSRAIELPALKSGIRFAPGLVDAILDEAADEPGALPLVQFVLEQLWRRRSGDLISFQDYEALGKLSGALASHADATLSSLSHSDFSKARNLFGRLVRVTVGESQQADTRVPLQLSPEVLSEFGGLIPLLTDRRLLVTSRDRSSRLPLLELSHEAIIHHWETLRGWLEQDRALLLWKQKVAPLIQSAAEDGNETSFLLRGSALVEAETWKSSVPDRLSMSENDFIEKSSAAREEEKDRIRRKDCEAAVKNLRLIDVSQLREQIRALHSEFPDALPLLNNGGTLNREERLKLSCARAAYGDTDVLQDIVDSSLALSLDWFLVLVEILRPFASLIREEIWKKFEAPGCSDSDFVRLGALAASFDSGDVRWARLGPLLVQSLVRESPTVIVPLSPTLRSVRHHLLHDLEIICSQSAEDDARRSSAALLVAILAESDVPLIAKLACVAPAAQYFIFSDVLTSTPEARRTASTQWRQIAQKAGTVPPRELAGAILNLLRFEGSGSVLRNLFSDPSDLSSLSEFLLLCHSHGIEPERIWNAIECGLEAPALYAAILALGTVARPGNTWIQERLNTLVHLYGTHPDSGVHSSLRWLLRTWAQMPLVDELDFNFAETPFCWTREWNVVRVASRCITFVSQSRRNASVGTRSALASLPVTKGDFIPFRWDAEISKFSEFCPTPECPIVGASWFDAIDYCEWVQAQLPTDIPLTVRLPRDREWEIACRADTATDFFFGNDSKYFHLWGWYYANAVSHTQAVGAHRPNPRGLFDMHGNTWEWCMDHYTQDGINLSELPSIPSELKSDSRLLRGGAWCDSPTWCRSDQKSNPHWPSDRNMMFGFRVACIEKSEFAAGTNPDRSCGT